MALENTRDNVFQTCETLVLVGDKPTCTILLKVFPTMNRSELHDYFVQWMASKSFQQLIDIEELE